MNQVWIGGYKVDWQRCEISIDNLIVSVEPKVLDVLQALTEAKGNVVSQQEVLARVWGDTIVAPNALQRCIARLRKVLGDDAKRQQVICTHPKRGYSLVALVSEQPPDAVQGFKVNAVLMFSLLLLVIAGVSVFWLLSRGKPMQYDHIIPITTSDQVERQPALSADQRLLAYIRGDKDNDQLVIKDMSSEQSRTIVERGRFRGAVEFSPDEGSLAYAERVFHQGIKCSRLMAISLESNHKTVLKTCDNDFLTLSAWLEPKLMLFFKTSKAGLRQLKLLDLNTGVSHGINNLPGAIVALDYHRANEKLALLTRGKDQQLYLSVATLDKVKFEVAVEHSWPLEISTTKALKPKWFNENKIVFASEKSIYWYGKSGLEDVTRLLSNDSVYSVLPYHNDKLIAVMGTQDWDVRESELQGPDSNSDTASSPKTIARSTYGEYNAQFRPSSQDVSFISFRSGKGQIWLNAGSELSQISNSEAGVDSYIWSTNEQKLAYVSDGALWLKPSTESSRHIVLNFKVNNIYQWWQDAQRQDYLLLSVLINDTPQIISLNLNTFDYITESTGPSDWAQKVAEHSLIVNDHRGRLMEQTPQGLLNISSLQDVVLHWRYLWRDNKLYFQDKAKNIWRYQPADRQAEVFAHYDEQAIFMTDINPERQSMLTENFVAQHKDIYLFKNSN